MAWNFKTAFPFEAMNNVVMVIEPLFIIMNTSFLHMFSCHTEQAGEIWSASDCICCLLHYKWYSTLPWLPRLYGSHWWHYSQQQHVFSPPLWDWICLFSCSLEFSLNQELELVHNESLHQSFKDKKKRYYEIVHHGPLLAWALLSPWEGT